MHGKKIVGIIIASLALALTSGCIVSSSPSNDQTIVMQPGESKTFSVSCIGGPIIVTHIDGFGNIKPEIEISLGSVGAFTITASTKDIGRHTVEITEYGSYLEIVDTWGGPRLEFKELYRDTREWDVVVCGVYLGPDTSIVYPGAVQDYTAKAYPEGSYAYAWYLDGALSSTGESHSFAPTTAQCGTHTLTIKATGEGTSYESTIRIQVPFAIVKNGNSGFRIERLAQTPDGGHIIAGYSYYDSSGIPVIKLAADGSLQWHSIIGGNDDECARGVIATADGGFIVAGTSSSHDIPGAANHGEEDVYLVKLDAQGAVVWQRLYGGSANDEAADLIPTADGGFIIIGCSSSQDIMNLPGHGDTDFYVLKFDVEETIQWQRLYDMGAYDDASSIRQTTDGGYIMTGNTYVKANSTAQMLKLDPEGNVLWSQSIHSGIDSLFNDVLVTSDGGYLASGKYVSYSIISGETYDALVVKFDALGNQIWQNTYGGEGNDYFEHLLPTSCGDFLAIGYSDSLDLPGYPADTGYAVKLNAKGKILRKERIPRVYDPIPVTDGYIALGYTSDGDVCLVKDGEF